MALTAHAKRQLAMAVKDQDVADQIISHLLGISAIGDDNEYTGDNTFSGETTFSGTALFPGLVTLNGTNTVSGITTFNGTQDFEGINTFSDTTTFERIKASGGTALENSDFALSSGFGDSASVAVDAGSTDQRGSITVTCGGTGQGANPTITLTFKDGTWTDAPFAVACRVTGNDQQTIPITVATTATTLVMTFRGTASGSEVYKIAYMVMG